MKNFFLPPTPKTNALLRAAFQEWTPEDYARMSALDDPRSDPVRGPQLQRLLDEAPPDVRKEMIEHELARVIAHELANDPKLVPVLEDKNLLFVKRDKATGEQLAREAWTRQQCGLDEEEAAP